MCGCGASSNGGGRSTSTLTLRDPTGCAIRQFRWRQVGSRYQPPPGRTRQIQSTLAGAEHLRTERIFMQRWDVRAQELVMHVAVCST